MQKIVPVLSGEEMWKGGWGRQGENRGHGNTCEDLDMNTVPNFKILQDLFPFSELRGLDDYLLKYL